MKVITTVVGSLQTNCYLLIDEETKSAALIDPGDEVVVEKPSYLAALQTFHLYYPRRKNCSRSSKARASRSNTFS